MPKISVIVPVLNAGKYIDHCLESIVNQTVSDIEILLMVGFGKDDSLDRCLSWQKKDGRIIVVSRRDTSLGDARNYALKLAKGEYIAYADADDYYSPEYLQKMCEPLETDQSIDISCCEYSRFDDYDTGVVSLYRNDGVVELDYDSYLVEVPQAAVWMKLFRRKWLFENGIEMFDGCCEDQALHFVLAALVKKAFLIKEPLYHYNVGNEGSLVRTLESMTDYAPAVEYAIAYLEEKNLYEINRNAILNKVCQFYQDFLRESGNEEKVRLSAECFIEKYFPEVIEDYEASLNSDRCIQGKVILYGAGDDSATFLKRNDAAEAMSHISYIVDRNPQLQGKERNGLVIRSPQDMYAEKEKISVIIASRRYYYEIVRELRSHGVNSIFKPDEFIDACI